MSSKPILPAQWWREQPARGRKVTESDLHEVEAERFSFNHHEHDYWTPFGFTICRFCGGWKERIEGRVP